MRKLDFFPQKELEISSLCVLEAKTRESKAFRTTRPPTCTIRVPMMMIRNTGLVRMPEKTERSPCTFRALISLKICIRTKVLKIMVKWTEGRPLTAGSVIVLPSSMLNNEGPAKTKDHPKLTGKGNKQTSRRMLR